MTRTAATRTAVWTGITVAVVLTTRMIVYAVAPSQGQILAELEHETGSPQLARALAVISVLAGVAAVVVLWLAVLAVRERLALEQREFVETPRIRPLVLGARAVALCAVASFAFAMMESYIHWREGLGWHGLHCLVGPVHRDAIPVLIGLSLLATALHGAIEHLLAWARRLVALLAARLPLLRGAASVLGGSTLPVAPRICSDARPRGPPAGSLLAI